MHFVSVDDSCSIISCYYDEVFAFWVLAWFLVFSFVPLLCRLFCYSGKTFMNVLSFLVKYLWNLICLMESWVLGLLYTYLGFMNHQ